MSGHTKGPWCVMQYGYEKYSVNGEHGVEICGAWRRQDAQLIAAAPDLLEALESLIEKSECYGLGEECAEYNAAKAAIARARGEK